MVEFMERYPDFATGRLSVVNAKDKFREMWKELANKLNCLGFGVRPVEKWQKTWSDYKSNLKKKASEIKRYQNATGGGPEITKKLTDLELRFLAILGKVFYEGCGVKELGLLDLPDDSANKNLSHINETCSNTPFVPIEPSDIPSSSKYEPAVAKPIPKKSSKRLNEFDEYSDHDYIYSPPNKIPKKANKSDNMTSIYKDTISQLEKIDETVGGGLQNLQRSIATNIDALRETVANGFQSLNQTLQELFQK